MTYISAKVPQSPQLGKNASALAHAATLYYKEGLTQSEIAQRLKVSRITVMNYLRQAHELNIVDIRILGEAFRQTTLSRELCEKFKLKDAYVAQFGPDDSNSATPINPHVARIGASALVEIVNENELLGVAWGETIDQLAMHVPFRVVSGLSVCQIIGSMTSPLVSTAESCAIRIAGKLGAECYTLHAPAVLSTTELADALRNESVIRNQLERFERLTHTLFSVGDIGENSHIVLAGIVSKTEFDWFVAQGAAGIMCGRFIDEDGHHIEGEMDRKMIGINPSHVAKTRNGILVAGGSRKLRAIRAALAGNYVRHLVVDEAVARELLH
jgi:deoxyribonucleoside regulator